MRVILNSDMKRRLQKGILYKLIFIYFVIIHIYSRGVFEVNSEHIKNDTKVLIAISTSFLLCTLFSKDHCSVVKKSYNLVHSVKLGYKERMDSMNILAIVNHFQRPIYQFMYFMNSDSEQPGISEK